MRSVILAVAVVAFVAPPAGAGDVASGLFSATVPPSPPRDVWQIDWLPSAASAPAARVSTLRLPESRQDPEPVHRAAIEHSDAYRMRAKLHRYASFATIPLFAAQVALGQSLYNNNGNGDSGSGSGSRGAHAAVGAGIVGLFGVNTVTGVWNMFGSEGRRDRDGRTLRLVHGLLMMAADIGFVATSATTPEDDRRAGTVDPNRAMHRNLAFASIGLGTAGYLTMLFGNR